ncbi:hypothetical protein BDB00DRAFT_867906 [Zychaea mexicana]|uniref:uncharacterized protein n=1 Tax=Zychaea mexicana TaxID=64656 RepID=UPI0022FDC92B|nr:uncharacterized protein BDB00DRAFT_867906 [Zychaea mexicana]KAI9498270.1 hypothetical protein BDB00DRAFT_867906 [Zychaea mexicana]
MSSMRSVQEARGRKGRSRSLSTTKVVNQQRIRRENSPVNDTASVPHNNDALTADTYNAQAVLGRVAELEKRATGHEQELFQPKEELKYMRDLINEKQQLRSDTRKLSRSPATQCMQYPRTNGKKARQQHHREERLQRQLAALDKQQQRKHNITRQQPSTQQLTAPTPRLTTRHSQLCIGPYHAVLSIPHSEIRRALRLLGVAQERVIDIRFPAHGAEAKTLHQERMFPMYLRMPKKPLAIAIMRHFTTVPEDREHLSEAEARQLLGGSDNDDEEPELMQE